MKTPFLEMDLSISLHSSFPQADNKTSDTLPEGPLGSGSVENALNRFVGPQECTLYFDG